MNKLDKIKRRLTRAIYAFISTLRDEVTHYPASVISCENNFRNKFGSKYAGHRYPYRQYRQSSNTWREPAMRCCARLLSTVRLSGSDGWIAT